MFLTRGLLLVLVQIVLHSPFSTCIQLGKNSLNRALCMNAVGSSIEELCCSVYVSEDQDSETMCLSEHQDSMENDKSDSKLTTYSRYTECIFDARGYIKSDDELDMENIRASAKRIYGKDKMQMNFMIDMYRDCGDQAASTIAAYKSDPEQCYLIENASKPYFLFVYNCLTQYVKMKCPFFRWTGAVEEDEAKCFKYASECKGKYFPETKLNIL